ncbi:MAG: NrfD/PsrC family molybdoenzyme membrane anchor subunit, partial [Planctomycetota bacterium]
MIHEQAEGKWITPTSAILILLMVAGAVAAVYRYFWGLGHSTNLSDQYPWGLWVGVDVMSGVALAAGGFTTAALVYLFGGEKYDALVRPAVLTGFLGYVFAGIGLLLDLALPWHIWHPIIIWPGHSVMFEVAWCVMLYLTVLA